MSKKEKKTGRAKMPKDGSIRTLFAVYKKNVPWIWLILNFVFSMFMGYFYVQLPDITAKITAGEIFENSLIVRFVVLSGVQAVCIVIASMTVKFFTYFTEKKIKQMVWKKLVHLKMKDFDREQPSAFISRVTADTTMATELLTSLMEGLICLFYLFIIFFTLYGISSSAAFAILCVVPYLFIIAMVPGKLKYKWAVRRQDSLACYTGYVREKLSSVRVIRTGCMTEEDIQKGEQKAEDCYNAEKTLALIEGIIEPFIYLSQIVVNLITITIGGKMVQSGQLENARLLTLYLQGSNFYNFALMTISMYYTLRLSHGSTKKIGMLSFLEPEEMEAGCIEEASDNELSFRDVSFSYGAENVLEHVSFSIPAGETTAIIGPSGSGKSTVLALLERLYDPKEGCITLSGKNAGDFRLDDWRRHIGVVQQSCPMIGGSIRDNIIYGCREEPTDEEVLEAAEKAGIKDFILALPEGLDTHVGQMGDKISGGQRQRIVIARSFLKNPEILLLDEPTSNLDKENAEHVNAALDNMSKERTTVIVAHNLRDIEKASHFVVLRGGRKEAEGTREEVFAASETFRKYCSIQDGESR